MELLTQNMYNNISYNNHSVNRTVHMDEGGTYFSHSQINKQTTF